MEADFSLAFKTSKERLDIILSGKDQEDILKRLNAVIDHISDRFIDVIKESNSKISEMRRQQQYRIDKCWIPLAEARIRTIVDEGALAPGLSHHEIYVGELREAFAAAESFADFKARAKLLIDKWGSKLKYPLFASRRKKDLTELMESIERDYPAAQRKAEASTAQIFESKLMEIHDSTRENIHLVSVDFGSILQEVFSRSLGENQTVQLRWLIIQYLNRKVYGLLRSAVEHDDTRLQDYAYYIFERVLMQVYDSFRAFVSDKRKELASGSSASGPLSGIDLRQTIDLEIQKAQSVTAQFENQIRNHPLTPKIIGLIRNALRSGAVPVAQDPKVFAEICGGLRTDRKFCQFLGSLKQVKLLDEQQADEIAVAIKTSIEPFRSLTYSAITLVRYLKGLQSFKPPA